MIALLPGPLLADREEEDDITWVKLGGEFFREARDWSDAMMRTHWEAISWSNECGLDLLVPKRDFRRFAESPSADVAVKDLVALGWWEDQGDAWYIGVHHADWQLESSVVEKRRSDSALRMRRSRMHKAGDHSLCIAGGTCPHVARNEMRNETRDETRHPVRDGTGPTDPTVP